MRRLATLLTVALLAAGSCSQPPQPTTVLIIADAVTAGRYRPQVITVRPGTQVTWLELDDRLHTVTASDRSFGSRLLDRDHRFTVRFDRPARYAYYCVLHPAMIGEVVVAAPG